MKYQALFSSKDNSKKLKCRLLQFLFCALRVKKNFAVIMNTTVKRVNSVQVNLIITRMLGCINSDRVINERRYSFENDLTSPVIAVVGGVQVISHAYAEFRDKTTMFNGITCINIHRQINTNIL